MSLLDRLREALSTEYDVEREVAGGGMGVVFAARHRRLDRVVAVKVLRPELATAVAVERFVAEGRILARLAHPSIVPVYDAGESQGFLYCVMEFIEGETLARRLERGPLAPDECLGLATDLLAALTAAHHEQIVHRDIKPQNIFLRNGRALLGDFGIAHWREHTDGTLTGPGQFIGTPSYMPPEQLEGGMVTARTDVYAAGMVLYEAWSGRRWPPYQPPGEGDWSAVPSRERGAIRGALAVDPAERWPDAGAFASALMAGRRPRWPLLAAVPVLVALVFGVLRVIFPPHPPPPPPARGALTVAVDHFSGSGPGGAALADSVVTHLRHSLADYPDFDIPLPGDRRADSAAVRISGTVRDSAGMVWLSATAEEPAVGTRGDVFTTARPRSEWRAVADELARRLVREMFRSLSATDRWLPSRAIPDSGAGFDLFFKAEQFLAQARYEEAQTAYMGAIRADLSCYLCSFRLLDIDRWLGQTHDSLTIRRLREGLDRFPDHYQSLIRAALSPLPARLDTLRKAAEHWVFYLASFEYGDEVLHRGPLYGQPRSDALAPLERAVELRKGFGPGWEHLTWLQLSEGDSASAARSLASLTGLPLGTEQGFSASMRVFLKLAYDWRFLPKEQARRSSEDVLAIPGISNRPEAVAGARLLMTADAPRGAVEFGGMLAGAWPQQSKAREQGLLGQLFGYAALGWLDSLRATGHALNRSATDPSLGLLALELEAVLRAFDPDSELRRRPDLLKALDAYLTPGALYPELRHRAAWASALLAARSGDTAEARATRGMLQSGPQALRGILDAVMQAERGDSTGALRTLLAMPALEGPGPPADPLVDAVVRLLEAELYQAQDSIAAARRELLWYQNLQILAHGEEPPYPSEMAWALGTLARWRLAHLATGAAGHRERCAALRGVIRHWKDAPDPLGPRAVRAEVSSGDQGCGP